MPIGPKRPCTAPMCPALLESGYPYSKCPAHQKAKYKAQDARRESFKERGYDSRWPALRVEVLQRDGWRCVDCGWEPRIVTDYREDGLGVPNAALVLATLKARFNSRQQRHLHGRQRHLHVDHILPGKARPDLFYEPTNLQVLCSSCHSRKTMVESVQPLNPNGGGTSFPRK